MRSRWIPGARFLPELALGVAALVAALRVTGIGAGLASLASPLLPFGPSAIDPLDAVTAAFALAALAAGVRRRKRLAWPLAVILFGAAMIAQALVLRHPIGAAVSVACLVILLADSRGYRISTDRRMRLVTGGIMAAGVVVLVGGSILVNLAAAATFGSWLDHVGTWTVEVLDFLDPTGLVTPGRSGELLEGLEFIVGTAVLVAAMALLAADPDRPPPDLLDRDRSVARRHATGSIAPFQTGPDALFYAEPTGNGVVAYGRAGRTAVVLGDPVGPRAAAWRAFRAFEARCAMGDVAVSVYQASAAEAAEFASRGYRTFGVGEEAVIGLPTWGLAGSARANLRHTVTRARRGGIEVSWRPDGLDRPAWERWGRQLVEVDRAWQKIHGPGMRFTISPFDPADLLTVGVAVATDGSDTVQAFATFRRTEPDGWVLDLMRRRQQGPPGALEACIAVAASAMRDAGDLELSLGLVALAGLTPGRGPIEERLLGVGRMFVGPFYDVAGLRFFKAKFDPEWHPRFGAVRGALGIVPYLVALLRLHLAVGTARPAAATPAGSSVAWIQRRISRVRSLRRRAAPSGS